MCALLLLPLLPLKVMRTQIQKLWLLRRWAAVYHVSLTRRLVNNLYYLKPTAGFHTSVHWAFWDTQAIKPPPVRRRPLYLPLWLLNPPPCYLSQLILHTSAEGPQPTALDTGTAAAVAAGCSQTRLEEPPRSGVQRLPDSQTGGSRAARSAQIRLAAEEHAAWSWQAGLYERMSVPRSLVWLICVIKTQQRVLDQLCSN